MYRPVRRTLFGLASVALLAQWAMAAQPVRAAAGPVSGAMTAYVVQPEANQPQALIGHGYFTLTLKPGQSQTVRLAVKNTGKQVLYLSDYPADAAQMTAGGIDFSTRLQHLKAVGTWISVQPKSLTLAPGQARQVTATITMARNAHAGDYVGGVALENKTVQGQGAGSHLLIDVHYRQAIAILAAVPGVRTLAARVEGVTLKPEPKGSQAVVSVRNTGNILFKGKGTIELLGSKGAVESMPFTIDTILPPAVTQIPINLPNLTLQRGLYGMRVSLSSVRNVPIAAWHGNVGYMMPQKISPSKPAKNVVLQPAQQAPRQQSNTGAQPAKGTSAAGNSTQTVSPLVLGGGAALVLLLGLGLGVFVSRRSARKRERP
jgi:hypothetical protein